MAAPAAKRARTMAAPTTSWVPIAATSDFSMQNIPFGIISTEANATPRVATAIGDHVGALRMPALDLAALAAAGLFPADYVAFFSHANLNAFMAAGRPVWRAARQRIQALLAAAEEDGADGALRENEALKAAALIPLDKVTMHLPSAIGDYTDFYSSREHATNVGIMFRGKDNALQPNWLHLPVGYHGRSSSVVLSGQNFKRPCGQLQTVADDPSKGSVYGACKQLDFELEVGTFVGPGNAMGEPIGMEAAENHIFGLVLLNDWSARDIQKWEYVPLGPFGAKNFCTSISAWVVTLDALEPFRCATSAGAQVDPEPLPYLRDPAYGSYDLHLEVSLQGRDMAAPAVISKSNFKYLYWNIKQQLVHHTVTGCNMRPGDLLGSGTISGPTPDSFGSMLELAWKGTKPIELPDGSKRVFLQDGDAVTIRGWCERDGMRVGLGSVTATVLPASPFKPAEVAAALAHEIGAGAGAGSSS